MGTIAVHALSFLRPIFAGGLYNAAIAAAATGMVYLIARKFFAPLQAIGLALVWAATPIFWAETAGVEVYTLNVLLCSLVLLAVFARPHHRWLLLAYLFGLSLSNHPSALSLGAGLIFLYIAERQYKRPLRLIPMAALVILAGTIYFYLWAASVNNPISDWGNPQSFSALWAHMRMQQYSGWVENSWADLWYAAKLYFRTVVECYTYAGVVLLASGIVIGWQRLRRQTIFLLLVLATSLFLAAFHQAVDYVPFYLIPMLMTLLLISLNLEWLRGIAQQKLISGIALIAIAVVMALVQFPDQDKSDYVLYEDYSRDLLNAVPQDGLLFLCGDINTFGPTYLRYAEGYRSDLTLYDRSIRKQAMLDRAKSYGAITDDLYTARNLLLYLEHQRKFLAKNHYQNVPEWWGGLDTLHSYGMLYEFGPPPDTPMTVPQYPANYHPGDLMSRELLVNLDLIRGQDDLDATPPDSAGAEDAFEMALHRYDRERRGILFNQIGIFFRRMGFDSLAIKAYREGLQRPILAQQTRNEISRNISNIYKARANFAMRLSRYDIAIENFVEAQKYDPENAKMILDIALIYERKLGRPHDAVPYYERYLKLKPDDDRVRRALEAIK